MDSKNIKLIDGSVYTLDINTPDLITHFTNSNNYTSEILHQFNNLDYYKDFISADDKIFIDLGGNIGLFAIHVSPFADKIVSVEPTPSHISIFKHLTSTFNNIYLVEGAISNKTGKVVFYKNAHNTTMNSLIHSGSDAIEVDGYSFRDILEVNNLHHVDFVKMDIEGSELLIIDDELVEYMSRFVKKILIEIHCVNNMGYDEIRTIFKQKFEKFYTTESFNVDGLYCYRKVL